MKTKPPLFYLLSFIFYLLLSPVPCALSQVPQGFNYQAIARDGSGNILPNTPLQAMIYIQSLSTGGTIFWKELHSSVTTNSFGLFTLVIGTGVRQPASIVASFDLIDWSVTPNYLKTEIYYSGSWKDMGASQLYSVPYAMTARDLKGTTKLGITGTTANLEEALFEVKNKDGQTVFAVYNEGVRVYVSNGSKAVKGGFAVGGFGTDKAETTKYLFVGKDSVRIYLDTNPLTKGTKSGFAVGGYDLTKGTVQNYLDVSSDSIRMYIDKSTKGVKGGFAVGGFDMTKGTKERYLNIATDAGGIINPAQNRILWYPLKNAFLTGKILIQSVSDVGENSFASGYTPKAKGMYSQAMGFMPQALGNYSTAIGKNAVAEKVNSFAFGDGANAKGLGSYAFGTNAEAQGDLSFALGSVGVDSSSNSTGRTIAKGYGAFAIGFGSYSSGQGAITLGVEDTASGDFSSAIGYRSVAIGWGSSALGSGTHARGIGSVATGWGSQTKPDNWFAWGAMANNIATTASNFAATSFGDRTTASGHTSFATGYRTTASGHLGSTFGDMTTAAGDGSVAMGHGTTAQAYGSLAIGRYNTVFGNSGTWNYWDPAFIVGNGTSSSARSNAFVFYNSGIADFAGYLNLNTSLSFYEAIKINNVEALWYNGTYFSWGFGGTYNVFAQPVSVATTANPAGYGLYVAGSVYATGGWAGSDARWKKDLEPLQANLPEILKLQGYKFNWRDEEYPELNFDKERQVGLIAQEVEKVYPELVKTDQNGYKAVSYEKLTVILIEGMKEQQKQIDAQNQKNRQLETDLQSLKEEMVQIKAILAKGDIR
jgi:hypothetical protein